MSYVIQNFFDCNKKIILTPRLKNLLFLVNFNKFLIFLKLNSFFFFNNFHNNFKITYHYLFFKSFYSKFFFKFFSKLNINFSNYDNNLNRSVVYKIFFNTNNFLKNKTIVKSNIFFNNFFLYNSYFISFKILNLKLNSFFYKNIFFFFFINNFFIWIQNTNNFKFYLNFIFINFNWKISRFYNSHFLRIYNY